jgi:RecA/RadA recombinase
MPSVKAKNAFARLRELEGAMNDYTNPHLDVIRSSSPSFNFIWGNGHGLPAGYSALFWGPPKGGKSLVSNSMIGQLHKDDPEAYAVKFNTEHRERAQLSPQQLTNWGIDIDRYLAFETNTPDHIYDYICKDIAEECANGLKLKLVVIDSINDIIGRRAMNDEKNSVMTQQRGDDALTNQEGLRRILSVQRKYNFGLIIVSQQRANQDPDEQARGNTTKAGVANATFHHCEYSVHIERNVLAAAKTDLLGNKFVNEDVSRIITSQERKTNDGEQTGHKIRCIMKDSSMGPKGRVAEFTVDYDHGIVNQHEEVFLLGVGRHVIEHPNPQMYAFGGKEWRGKQAIIEALKGDVDMQNAILRELRARDARGDYAKESVVSVSE